MFLTFFLCRSIKNKMKVEPTYYRSLYCTVGNKATRSVSLIIYSQFDAGSHIQCYPWCPAEGQSLQRGHIRNMAVFSLMTHSTINTLQLSRSACGYGGVYWLLAFVPWRTLARPADHLPDWSWRRSSLTHAQYSGARQPHRRKLTHIAAEGPMRRRRSHVQWGALLHVCSVS